MKHIKIFNKRSEKLISFFVLTVSLVFITVFGFFANDILNLRAVASDPGHDASGISPGTFDGGIAGVFTFPGSINLGGVSKDEWPSGGDSDWTISGVDMYSGVTGNVGVGDSTPIEGRLVVRGTDIGVYSNGTNTGVEGVGTTGVHGVGENGVVGDGSSAGVIGKGTIWDFVAQGAGIDYFAFTGSHEVKLSVDFPKNVKKGMVVSVTGDVEMRKDKNGEISISSTMPTIKLSDKENDKAVFGVFGGEFSLSEDHWYEEKDSEKFAAINAVGEGRAFVTNTNGDIEAGDYITTSSIPGYGQKQDDDLLHSYTLGKATETVDWDSITETEEFNGNKYKIYLIGVVYTSG